MCSRYSLISPPDAVRSYFRLAEIDTFPPRYNIAPTQPVGIIRHSVQRIPEFALVRWGLIPGWVKNPMVRSTLVNARAESAMDKPSFRGALRHRRCLVPADAFYEWSGRSGAKVPYLIRPRNGGLMALAGLWEHWVGADGSELETMAFLTVAANATLAPVHDRMPVILSPDVHSEWLDCRSGRSVEIARLLCAPADEMLETVEISTAVNDVRNEGPALHVGIRRTLL